jgi:Spy/CpxP family protein refolding chaperone
MENEKTVKRVKKIAAFVLIGAAVAVSSVACGMHGMKMSEKMMRAAMEDHVDELMDDINATDAQRAEFTLLSDSIVNEAIALRSKEKPNHQALLAALKKDKVDREAIHSGIENHIDTFEAFLFRSLDRVLDAYEKLRPEQKQIILDKLANHMENN